MSGFLVKGNYSEDKLNRSNWYALTDLSLSLLESIKNNNDNFSNVIQDYLTPNPHKRIDIKKRINQLLNPMMDYGVIRDIVSSMDYKDFLKTLYWKTVAYMVKKRDNYRCQKCGSNKKLNVHHKTYKHHGDEIHHLEDLVCLCLKCHKKQHSK